MKITKKIYRIVCLTALAAFILSACQSQTDSRLSETSGSQAADTGIDQNQDERSDTIRLTVDGQELAVEWEDNQSVAALREHVAEQELTITLTAYEDFEQVRSLGITLPSENSQQTAVPGDIMLYNDSNIVLFYGSNSWSYTNLGHISDSSVDLEDLLDKEEVTVTLSGQD
ncbi:cyclophilin-like fold protein [Streptococcus chenjunshii]|uniref:cyclophilin-like fold protein n=1 Tax=Streptococcus chenjunshii TaxID=2173853 RepID=UPI0015F33285|nr:cyclophilin-like fold protein [Streptococcus chenjunshii]